METVKAEPNREPIGARQRIELETTSVQIEILYPDRNSNETIGQHLDLVLLHNPDIREVKIKISN